eukprot:g2283.t1
MKMRYKSGGKWSYTTNVERNLDPTRGALRNSSSAIRQFFPMKKNREEISSRKDEKKEKVPLKVFLRCQPVRDNKKKKIKIIPKFQKDMKKNNSKKKRVVGVYKVPDRNSPLDAGKQRLLAPPPSIKIMRQKRKRVDLRNLMKGTPNSKTRNFKNRRNNRKFRMQQANVPTWIERTNAAKIKRRVRQHRTLKRKLIEDVDLAKKALQQLEEQVYKKIDSKIKVKENSKIDISVIAPPLSSLRIVRLHLAFAKSSLTRAMKALKSHSDVTTHKASETSFEFVSVTVAKAARDVHRVQRLVKKEKVRHIAEFKLRAEADSTYRNNLRNGLLTRVQKELEKIHQDCAASPAGVLERCRNVQKAVCVAEVSLKRAIDSVRKPCRAVYATALTGALSAKDMRVIQRGGKVVEDLLAHEELVDTRRIELNEQLNRLTKLSKMAEQDVKDARNVMEAELPRVIERGNVIDYQVRELTIHGGSMYHARQFASEIERIHRSSVVLLSFRSLGEEVERGLLPLEKAEAELKKPIGVTSRREMRLGMKARLQKARVAEQATSRCLSLMKHVHFNPSKQKYAEAFEVIHSEKCIGFNLRDVPPVRKARLQAEQEMARCRNFLLHLIREDRIKFGKRKFGKKNSVYSNEYFTTKGNDARNGNDVREEHDNNNNDDGNFLSHFDDKKSKERKKLEEKRKRKKIELFRSKLKEMGVLMRHTDRACSRFLEVVHEWRIRAEEEMKVRGPREKVKRQQLRNRLEKTEKLLNDLIVCKDENKNIVENVLKEPEVQKSIENAKRAIKNGKKFLSNPLSTSGDQATFESTLRQASSVTMEAKCSVQKVKRVIFLYTNLLQGQHNSRATREEHVRKVVQSTVVEPTKKFVMELRLELERKRNSKSEREWVYISPPSSPKVEQSRKHLNEHLNEHLSELERESTVRDAFENVETCLKAVEKMTSTKLNISTAIHLQFDIKELIEKASETADAYDRLEKIIPETEEIIRRRRAGKKAVLAARLREVKHGAESVSKALERQLMRVEDLRYGESEAYEIKGAIAPARVAVRNVKQLQPATELIDFKNPSTHGLFKKVERSIKIAQNAIDSLEDGINKVSISGAMFVYDKVKKEIEAHPYGLQYVDAVVQALDASLAALNGATISCKFWNPTDVKASLSARDASLQALRATNGAMEASKVAQDAYRKVKRSKSSPSFSSRVRRRFKAVDDGTAPLSMSSKLSKKKAEKRLKKAKKLRKKMRNGAKLIQKTWRRERWKRMKQYGKFRWHLQQVHARASSLGQLALLHGNQLESEYNARKEMVRVEISKRRESHFLPLQKKWQTLFPPLRTRWDGTGCDQQLLSRLQEAGKIVSKLDEWLSHWDKNMDLGCDRIVEEQLKNIDEGLVVAEKKVSDALKYLASKIKE